MLVTKIFSFFPECFVLFQRKKITILATFKLKSTNAFHFDQGKNLSLGKVYIGVTVIIAQLFSKKLLWYCHSPETFSDILVAFDLLTFLQTTQFYPCPNGKHFKTSNITQSITFVSFRVQNIMAKVKILVTSIFSSSHIVFKKVFLIRGIKSCHCVVKGYLQTEV